MNILIAFTNKSARKKRPASNVILAILTPFALVPMLAEELTRDRFEVAFIYPPYPPQPIIHPSFLFFGDMTLFLVCIVAGIALVRRQHWAWFLAIALLIVVIAVHMAASIAIGPDSNGNGIIGSFEGSYGRYSSILISLIAFYFLSRKDVRSYLRPAANN